MKRTLFAVSSGGITIAFVLACCTAAVVCFLNILPCIDEPAFFFASVVARCAPRTPLGYPVGYDGMFIVLCAMLYPIACVMAWRLACFSYEIAYSTLPARRRSVSDVVSFAGAKPNLPADIQDTYNRLIALLSNAEPLIVKFENSEASYTLRETTRRYLPDTIRAYQDIPSPRNKRSSLKVKRALDLIESQVRQNIDVLTELAEAVLDVNAEFLSTRFTAYEGH